MIIKYFGPNDGKVEEEGVNEEKIEFINMVEQLMQIAQRQKDYGLKLTSLAIMALVNMCNYNEDIQSIFRLKQGFPFIRGLLKSTDDEILLNTLRLLMTNVKPKDDNAKQHMKALIDDEETFPRMLYMLKQGPGIYYTEFNVQIKFMIIQLLRIFITHS